MEIVYYLILPFSCLSLLSCAIIVGICYRSEFIRNNQQFKLVYILSIIELILYLNRLIPPILLSKGQICTIQGTINVILGLINILWIDFISLEMYSVVIKGNSSLKYGLKVPFIIIFLISLPSGLFSAVSGYYLLLGPWCVAYSDKLFDSLMISIGLYFSIVWISILYNIIIAILVSKKLYNLVGDTQDIIVKKIKYYPLLLILVYTPISVCRITQDIKQDIRVLDIFGYIVISLEGFLNFIIFINHQDVRKFLKSSFKSKKSRMSDSFISLS